MASNVQKIVCLSTLREIPFNKLVLSQANVRRTKAGVSLEELAESIGRRGLLQNLNVRPVLGGDGAETGTFEVPAGGRRFRALEMLVKAKRLARTAPVPCNVRDADSPISAEEDSLAENSHREALHPLDQFRAFKTLVDQGAGEEDVAARFFVPVTIVRQRLRLASVAPEMLDVYAEDGMTLDQLMAFTVSSDHDRQRQVWETLSRQPYRQAYEIRRLLTEQSVALRDRRALFVGIEAYEAADGVIGRDLFSEHDGGGWMEDVTLVDRLAHERLAREAEAIGAEGWKWVDAAIEFSYGQASGMRRIQGQTEPLTDEEVATRDTLHDELETIGNEYDGPDDLPEEVAARIDAIEAALLGFERPTVYDPDEITRAGVFVSIGYDGSTKVERGFVRLEDEAPISIDPDADGSVGPAGSLQPTATVITVGGQSAGAEDGTDEDEVIRPLSERLVTELTAHRTLALRDAVGRDPDAAHLAVLHVLALSTVYHRPHESCLEISPTSSSVAHQSPGLADTASAKAIDERQAFWAGRLPERPDGLWDALVAFGSPEREALFAHCASLTVNVTHEAFNRRPQAMAHGGVLARAVGLDMAAAGWTPTADNYLGRVTKPRILEAVCEAKGEMAAQLIDHLKKVEIDRKSVV